MVAHEQETLRRLHERTRDGEYDSARQQVIVYVTTSGSGPGRAYNLVFPRVYPAGGQTSAVLANHGDFPAWPLLRFYGPITGASATISRSTGGSGRVAFQPSYVISGGHYVDVDTKARTALLDGDPAQNVYPYLVPDQIGGWPWIPPDPATATVVLNGTGTSSATQLQISWADPYLL